jgi:hypothetical protein
MVAVLPSSKVWSLVVARKINRKLARQAGRQAREEEEGGGGGCARGKQEQRSPVFVNLTQPKASSE